MEVSRPPDPPGSHHLTFIQTSTTSTYRFNIWSVLFSDSVALTSTNLCELVFHLPYKKGIILTFFFINDFMLSPPPYHSRHIQGGPHDSLLDGMTFLQDHTILSSQASDISCYSCLRYQTLWNAAQFWKTLPHQLIFKRPHLACICIATLLPSTNL